MPLETTTTRLQSISSKSGPGKNGGDPWTRYDFHLDGFRRPWSTFNKDLVDMSLQGKMVQASASTEERSFTPADSASPITFTQYTLQNIVAVEGESGTLNDVLAPVAQAQQVQTVVDRSINGTPGSPSEAISKDEQIRRSVAVQEAMRAYTTMLEAGLSPTNDQYKNLARLVYTTHGELG